MTTSSTSSHCTGFTSRLLWPACALAAVALVTLVYWNGLQGPFVLDDHVNILQVPAMALSEITLRGVLDAIAVTGNAFPDRGLARLSFALNHYFSDGYNVLDMKATSLAVHLGNAALIWLLGLRLLRRHAALRGWQGLEIMGRPSWQWAAFLAALVWAVHPLHVSTVLYIVQRMTSLSSLFVLLGALVFVIGRERLEAGRNTGWLLMWSGLAGGMALGYLCKENAILLPFLLGLVEVVFFERDRLPLRMRRLLIAFYGLTVAIPALLAVVALIVKWDWFQNLYLYRSFTVEERLLTQLRVLWFYLGLLALPNVRSYGVHHDDFTVSHSLLDPWTTTLALVAWAVVLVVALCGLRRRSLFSFAVLWYLIAHAVESSVLSLEMVFEHRSYVPSIGPLMAFSVALIAGLGQLLGRPRAVVAVAVLIVLTVSGVCFTRANVWQDKYTMAYFGVRNHPESPRYLREWASMISDDHSVPREEVFKYLQTAAQLQPDDVTSLYDMARFVDQRLYAQHQPPAWDDGSAPPDAVVADPLSTPLSNDVSELRALALGLDREISRRARGAGLLVSAAEIGRHMSRCITTADVICARMIEPALRWTALIAQQPHLSPAPRAISMLANAKMLAFTGDVDAAIETLQDAENLLPDDMHFRFQKATFMLELGRLVDAETALEEAEARMNWTGAGSTLLEALRRDLRAAQKQAAAVRRGGPPADAHGV